MHFVFQEMCKETKTVMTYAPTNLRFQHHAERLDSVLADEKPVMYEPEGTLQRYQILETIELRELRWAWAFMRTFNNYLVDAVHLVNFNFYGGSSNALSEGV